MTIRPHGDIFVVAVSAAVVAATFELISANGIADAIELSLIVLAVALVIPMRRRLLAHRKDMPVGLVQQHDRVIVGETSHQLRTPITIARGHAELLRSAITGDDPELHLEIIVDELDRMARLTERMLILASAGDPGFLVPSPVTVDSLVVDIAQRWRATAQRHWQVDCLDDTVVLADAARLTVAIDALVENAIQHTADGDLIVMGAHCETGEAIFTVRDNGRGMTAEEVTGLRAALCGSGSGGPRRPGGTGLGLRIARAIAEAHRGSLTVDSRRGFGSEFAVHIPRVRLSSQSHDPLGITGGP